jgi:hypothetical protein
MSSSINGIDRIYSWEHPSGYTLIFSPSCRDALSDTVVCTSISDDLMVISVKQKPNIGFRFEVDTLKKIRFWNP